MNLQKMIKEAEKFVSARSPQILTAVGVTGTIATAYLTATATVKATRIIDEAERIEGRKATNRDKVEMLWKLYIPAILTGTLTCTAIVMANRIGTRRTAAIAAAYTLSERAYSEYKDKVVEQIGKNKEQKVRDAVAEDRVKNDPVSKQQVVVTGGGEVLCYDVHTGRYFQSSMETLKKAQNDVNYQLLNEGYASLNEFYNKLALPSVKTGEDLGWNSENLLELKFTSTMSEDDRPCIAIDFFVGPHSHFFRTH